MIDADGSADSSMRAKAESRLEAKRDFRIHLRAYLAVNTLLVAIWTVAGAGFFWPIFPMLGWGIGISLHAWGVHWRKPISEEEIQRETEHLRRHP